MQIVVKFNLMMVLTTIFNLFNEVQCKVIYALLFIQEKLGNKEVDVEGLSIKSLHNYLWKCFLPASTSLANPNWEHLTLVLVCEQLYNLHYKC